MARCGLPRSRASIASGPFMYLLYVDASGTPELSDATRQYTLLGVCVHEGTWYALDRRTRALKEKYQHGPSPFELHAKDFCITIGEQADIDGFADLDWNERRRQIELIRNDKIEKYPAEKRRKKAKFFRRTEPFIHLTRSERTDLLHDGLELVGSHEGLVLLGEVVDKQHFLKVHGAASPVPSAFAQLVARYDAYLNRKNEWLKSGVEKGLLVMDREPTSEDRYRQLLDIYRQRGLPWGELRHVIEAPFFVDSELAAAIQLADLCAYVLRRHVEDPGNTHAEMDLKRIFHRFDRAGGKLHGLRHFCAKGSCGCMICRERGH